MFFGQCNALATFQNIMNNIFSEYLYGFLIIYMDDCLVFTKRLTIPEHMKKVCQVLQKMRENNLYLKISKCEFAKSEVKFLGWKVSKDGWCKEAILAGCILVSFLLFCLYKQIVAAHS